MLSQTGRLHSFVRSIDRLGGRLLRFRKRFVQYPQKLNRIILISIDSIRNVLYCIPALQLLKDSFPGAEIDFVTWEWAEPLLRKHRAIHEVFTYNPDWYIRSHHYHEAPSHHGLFSISWEFRRLEYDVLIVFQSDLRLLVMAGISGAPFRIGYNRMSEGLLLTHAVSDIEGMPSHLHHLRLLEPLGIKPCFISPELVPPPEDIASTHSILAGLAPDRKIIVIHPGGAKNGNPWPLESLIRTCRGLTDDGHQILVIADPMETGLLTELSKQLTPGMIQIWNYPTIGETMALARKTDLFIGLDSGAGYVFAVMNTPTIILTGTRSPRDSFLGSNVTFALPDQSCPGCRLETPEIHMPCTCVELIQAEQIVNMARQAFGYR
mgnify:FL=1